MQALYDTLDVNIAARAPLVASGQVAITDNLRNFMSQLGTAADKGAQGRFEFHWLDKLELDAMYTGDWLAGCIIDAIPDDMTRAWRQWKGAAKSVRAIERAEKKLNVRQKVNLALKQARLYGGSAIYIGTKDPDVSKPLEIDRLGRGCITYLHVLSRWEIWAGQIDRDPLSPHFGEPIYYMIVSPGTEERPAQGSVQIHPSRVVRFNGIPQLELTRQFDGWGFPLLQRVYDAVRNAAAAQQALASMMQEAKVDVVKIKDLTRNSMDAGWRERMQMRFSIAKSAKSINGMLLLDENEEYEQKKISLAEAPKVVATFLEVAAGAAEMPVTRLLGQPPGGLNGNGDGNIRHYYDTLHSRQTTELGPNLLRLDEVLERHAGVSPGSLDFDWMSLWQMTEAEKAAIALQKAQATQVIAATGTVPFKALAKGVQAQLVQDDVYPVLADEIAKCPPVTAPPAAPGADGSKPRNPAEVTKPASTAADDKAPLATLYVSRRVLNGEQIAGWAEEQGFATTVDPATMHVTVAFSREPVDWSALEPLNDEIVLRGDSRDMVRFGDATVLRFADAGLHARWQEFRDAGASWEHDGYQPHVTISWSPDAPDAGALRAYAGSIVLGPAEFQTVDEDWRGSVREI